jgi:hypothetical protein
LCYLQILCDTFDNSLGIPIISAIIDGNACRPKSFPQIAEILRYGNTLHR